MPALKFILLFANAVSSIALGCNCSASLSLSVFVLFFCLRSSCECESLIDWDVTEIRSYCCSTKLEKVAISLEHRMVTRKMTPEANNVPVECHRLIDS